METRIRELRRLQGLTLKALAERLSTTPQTVHRLETGTVAVSTEWLRRFADVFGVTPADLIAGSKAGSSIEFLGELGRGAKLRIDAAVQERFAIDVPAVRPVAVRVEEPVGPYLRGAILIGNRLEGPDLDAVRSCDALVAVDEKTVLLRRLIRSAMGHFILVPFSNEADIHFDVVPLWVARLVMRIDYL